MLANPDSPKAVTLVHQWVNSCLESHNCGSGLSTELPTRLLDVSSGTDDIRLFIPSENELLEGKYVTLSYCWGLLGNFTTTSDNYEARKSGISMREMPRTLRDAV